MSITSLLSSTCSIQRATAAADSTGGQDLTWTAFASSVKCRVQPASGTSRVDAGRDASADLRDLYMAYRSDLLPSDRIVWNGITWDIIMEPQDMGGANRLLKLLIERRR